MRETCSYCRDASRDQSLICVLEEPHNILPIETTRQFHGLYHVLHGAISPLRGIGPEQLRIKGLLHRIENGMLRNHSRHESNGGRRGHGILSFPASEASGFEGDANRYGHSRWQRLGVRG